MSRTSNANSKWVANIRLSRIKNDEAGWPEVETISKSFWSSDIKAIYGEWPVPVVPDTDKLSEEDLKTVKVLLQATSRLHDMPESPEVKRKRLEGRLKDFPCILFRDGSSYHIENKSDYDRLMKLLKES